MSLINEIKEMLSEVTKVNFKGNKFVLKIDVNEDPNKKGIKVQFLPTTFSGMSKQQQDDIAIDLGAKLNQGLAPLGLTVERDRELKDKTIVGFFIYIEYLDKIIINALSQAEKNQILISNIKNMAKFCFYSKSNPTQEPVGVVDALTKEEAIKFFSLSKQLPVNDFLTIFEVKNYTYGTQEGLKENTKQLLKG